MLVAPGSTSISVDVMFLDDSGFALTGKVAADFPACKWSGGSNTADTAITLSDLAAITTAHPNDNTAGGIKEREGGVYRLDLPNNVFTAAGRKYLTFAETTNKRIVVLGGMIDCQYVQTDLRQMGGSTQSATDLKDFADTGYDPATHKVETVKLADTLTTYTGNTPQTADHTANISAIKTRVELALPAASPASNGGLGTVDASNRQKADLDTIKTQSVTCSAGVTVSPFVGSTGAAINGTNANTLSSHDPGETIMGATDLGTGSGLTAIPWNAAWDAEVQSEVDDALVALNLDHLLKVAAVTGDVTNSSIIARLTSKSATPAFTDFDNTTDSLQAIRDNHPANFNGFSIDGSGVGKANVEEILGTNVSSRVVGDTSFIAKNFGYFWFNGEANSNAFADRIESILGDTNELQTDWVNGGRLDLLLDATLADTNELQADWANGGRLDLLIDAILLDTGTTLDGKIDTIDGIVDAILLDTGTDGVVLSAAQMNKIADHVLRRDWANVQASSDGDAIADGGSLYGLICRQEHSNTTDNAGFITIYNEDGTELAQVAIAVDASSDPMTGVG